jgi:hypothetical protein
MPILVVPIRMAISIAIRMAVCVTTCVPIAAIDFMVPVHSSLLVVAVPVGLPIHVLLVCIVCQKSPCLNRSWCSSGCACLNTCLRCCLLVACMELGVVVPGHTQECNAVTNELQLGNWGPVQTKISGTEGRAGQ